MLRISYTDLKDRKIGKAETLLLMICGLAYHRQLPDSILGGVILSGMTELVNLVKSELKGIGGGDIRLLFAIGLCLGLDRGLYAMLIGMGAALITYGCGASDRQMPLGPYLSMAAMLFLL